MPSLDQVFDQVAVVEYENDRFVAVKAVEAIVSQSLFPDGVQSGKQYEQVVAAAKQLANTHNYIETVLLTPPTVDFSQSGMYWKQLPPLSAEVVRSILQIHAYKDSLQPRHRIAEQTLLNELATQLHSKPLHQLDNTTATVLQQQVEQLMTARQWQRTERSRRIVYEAPIQPRLHNLLEVLVTFLKQQHGEIYASNLIGEATIHAYGQRYTLSERNRTAFAEMITIMQQALQQCQYEIEPTNGCYLPTPLALPNDLTTRLEQAIATVARVATQKGAVIVANDLQEAVITKLELETISDYHYDGLLPQLQPLLKAAGFRPKSTWLAPHQFDTPPANAVYVFLPTIFMQSADAADEDTLWIAIRRNSDKDSFPVLAPICIVDEREKCLIALRMIGHPEAVRASYARIITSGGGNGFYLSGHTITQRGLKQHKLVKAQLPMGLLDYFLIHKQASPQTMQGGQPFYVLDDRQQPIPPLFMPLLDKAIDTPTQAHWERYLWLNGIAIGLISPMALPSTPCWSLRWLNGIAIGLISPANSSGVGMVAWNVEADLEAWRDLISEGIRLGEIALHDADGMPISEDADTLPIISSYTTDDALEDGVLVLADEAQQPASQLDLPTVISETTFPLGRIVYTTGIQVAMDEQQIDPLTYLRRHSQQDWGDDMDAHDQKMNAKGLKDGYRILSSYESTIGRIFVITEWDRSVTTVLLSSEY